MSMAVATAAQRIFQEWKQGIMSSLGTAPGVSRDFVVEVPSSSKSTLHAWFLNQARVREWVGPRHYNNLSSRTWEVFNKDYELSYQFHRNQIDDDLDGLVANAVMDAKGAGAKWQKFEDALIAAAVEAGTTALCHDGQYFFDTDHPIDPDSVSTSSTYSNSLSLALNIGNFGTAITAFQDFKGVDNYPIVDPGSFILMVPTALQVAARQILNAEYITPATAFGLSGTSGMSLNPWRNSATLLVNPYLSDTTRWYLFGSSGIVKPIMLQRRTGLEQFESTTGDEIYINEGLIRFGGNARLNTSYTLPQLALTSKP